MYFFSIANLRLHHTLPTNVSSLNQTLNLSLRCSENLPLHVHTVIQGDISLTLAVGNKKHITALLLSEALSLQ